MASRTHCSVSACLRVFVAAGGIGLLLISSLAAEPVGGAVSQLTTEAGARPTQASESAGAWTDRFRLKGSALTYFLTENNSFFGRTSSTFFETAIKLGLEGTLAPHVTFDAQLVAEEVAGDPDNYTGVTTGRWNVRPDLANITVGQLLGHPLALTLGWQHLEYGDGFLIYDGHADRRAVWSSPVRSFPAAKAAYTAATWQAEVFGAFVDSDYTSYETYLTDFTTRTGVRHLYGTNLHLEPKGWGAWDLGVFYRNDESALASDTVAFSQRGATTLDPWPDATAAPAITLEGELVEEVGRTNVANHALTTSRRDRRTWGGHLDATASLVRVPFTPYVKASYLYLPGDDPETSDNEAFDPMFYGWSDWGTWYVGSLNSYNLFNYNQRTWGLEAGLNPTATTTVRAQVFHNRLDQEVAVGAGKPWSNEVNLILDWYPDDRFFAGAAWALNHPLKAAKAYAADDQDSTEFVAWAGVQF